MRFFEIVYKGFLSGFLCFCKETLGKKAAPRNRPCEGGSLGILLGIFRPLRFEGAKASYPRTDTERPAHERFALYRRVFSFCSVPAKYHHGRFCVVVIFFPAPTFGLRIEVILWEFVCIRGNAHRKITSVDLSHNILSLHKHPYPYFEPLPQKQKPPRRGRFQRKRTARGERSKKFPRGEAFAP